MIERAERNEGCHMAAPEWGKKKRKKKKKRKMIRF